jgi:hypothetical protein
VRGHYKARLFILVIFFCKEKNKRKEKPRIGHKKNHLNSQKVCVTFSFSFSFLFLMLSWQIRKYPA